MKLIERIPQELLDATNNFAKKLEWSRRVPVYEIHKWWARRYSGIVRLFLIYSYMDYNKIKKINNYDDFISEIYWNPPRIKGRTLLDPFCGGGTILLESSNLGFEACGIEINKLAFNILIAYKSLKKLDINSFQKHIMSFSRKINDKVWSTKCSEGHKSLIVHTFLSWKNKKDKLQMKYNEIKRVNNESIYYCEECNRVFKDKPDLNACPYCNNEFNKSFRGEFDTLHPYAIEYYCPVCKKREIKKVDKNDLKLFYVFKNMKTKKKPIPKLNETTRLLNKGFKDFTDLLTFRQNFTFQEFLKQFKNTSYERISKLMVSDALRSCSLLAYYSPKYRKVIPAFVIKSYWLPSQPVELNPLSFIENNGTLRPLGRGNLISSFRKLVKTINYDGGYNSNYNVYLGASQDKLKKIRKKFDIIFTDPPYADYQFYSDLSLFNLSIIDELSPKDLNYLLDKEIVLRKKEDIKSYKNQLYLVFMLMKKKLNRNGKIIVTFHHSDENMIKELLNIFKSLKLNLDAIYPVIGESSGKLSKRKLYFDLLFVLSTKKKETYYTTTNTFFTEEDKKLINSINKLVVYYNDER